MSAETASSYNDSDQLITEQVQAIESSTGDGLSDLKNDVIEPQDAYDPAYDPEKDHYEPTKVYEVTNVTDVGFGRMSLKTDHQTFTVNGPLFGLDNKPVGGYIDNGNKVKDFIDPAIGGGNFAVDNGIMGLGVDGKMHLIPYKDIKNSSISFKRAFQNGPMLVQNGQNVRGTSDTKRNRSGIGYRADGKVVIIYSDKPVTFREFADLFVQHGCINAMYLDGGPAAGYQDGTGLHGQLNDEATKLQFFHQK